MSAYFNLYFRTFGNPELATDSGDGLTFNLSGKDIQAAPAPKVYVNGVLMVSGYTINPGDQTTNGSVTFSVSQAGNAVKVAYRWKYECSVEETLTSYGLERTPNVKATQDANGKDMLNISYSPSGKFKGLFGFEYVAKILWETFDKCVQNAWTFDVEDTSDTTEPNSVSNCMVLPDPAPRYERIEGMPDMVNLGIAWKKI